MMTGLNIGAANNIQPSLLSNNPYLVSSVWILSSSIFTTYFTTSFLKYPLYSPNFLPTLRKKNNSVLPSAQQHIAVSDKSSSTALIDRATLLTLFRFGGSFFLGLLVRLDLDRIPSLILQTIVNVRYYIASALFLFVANYCNSISLNRLGVPLTYTSKCAIPLFTVLLVISLDGLQALPNALALCSLVLVALGIAAASWNSPAFDPIGFLAAITSTTAQAALNISSKRAMALSNTSGVEAQRVMVAVAFIITAIFSLAKYFPKFFEERKQQHGALETQTFELSSSSVCPPVPLAVLAVMAYHIEYVLSFMFVRLVSPLTYGTCDAVRRLIIIIAGKQMFGGPKFSTLNKVGITTALAGALIYSRAVIS